ncbi:MAG TPA: RnfABCDGE type electron transport complex subunit D [Candidatus Saccharimonadia bacterium]|nr:RnfABCDGE type electron transport complex subunit D [Candidatus Saccharimonadia bacterium]
MKKKWPLLQVVSKGMYLVMLKAIDKFIDSITMYRLLLYYLIALLVAAICLSAFGDLHYKPLYIAISAIILVVACWTINKVFSYIFDAPINPESSLITALILALIISPNPTGFNILFLLAASGLAMASKYLIAIRYKHIFNPAAIAVVLTALGPRQTASWWVGTAVMLPFVLIGGLLIMRKIRRERMVMSFFAATTLSTVFYSIISKVSVVSSLHNMILSSSVFFLGFVMLTEPLTSPPTGKKQTWYGVIVGFLLPPQVHLFSFYTTPELALIIGNAFSYIVSPKTKLFPILKQKIKIATASVDFIFNPDRRFAYEPGQYLEWTLQHDKTDSRGSRRYFSLASSPTEPDLRIGIKFYDKSSSFKKALLNADEDTFIVASQLAGDFVMPKDTNKKLVFIAGGIGITPFRSMVKYLLDKNQKRKVTLLYSARTQEDLAYKSIFEEARSKLGLNTIYAVTDTDAKITDPNAVAGFISGELIKQTVPDYLERVFYISGTPGMVKAMQGILSELGVPRHQIKVDYFSGYA